MLEFSNVLQATSNIGYLYSHRRVLSTSLELGPETWTHLCFTGLQLEEFSKVNLSWGNTICCVGTKTMVLPMHSPKPSPRSRMQKASLHSEAP